MELNQVTLPAIDVAESICFYNTMGFEPIVEEQHYARFRSAKKQRYRESLNESAGQRFCKPPVAMP